MSDMKTWGTWLQGIPPEQQEVLRGLLNQRAPGHSNGHGKLPEGVKADIKVTRLATEDAYITEPPPYVDIFKLHEFYQRVAFEQNLLLKGPKGDGKTLSVLAYAAMHKLPIVVQECSEDTKKHDLQGSQSLIGDETIYVLGAIPAAIDIANEVGWCILLFEELNALTPQVQKQLNAVTDFRKMSSLPHIGKTYTLRKDAYIWVVGTMNPSVYGGTYDLNEDLKSRFVELDLTYPEHAQELQIIRAACPNVLSEPQLKQLLTLAHESRQPSVTYALSTRDLVSLVKLVVKVGLDIALQTVVCKFEGEDRAVIIKRIKSIFPGAEKKQFWVGV